MRTLDGELGEVLVVMSGYNDPVWTIDEAIAGVVDEARGQGVDHVVWLSLRTSDDVDYSDPQEQSSINTFREYNEQLFAAAAASDGYLQVADWATYSNGASGWFEADGVHLTPRGVDAVTTFIAGTVERVLAGEDVSPAAAPWTVLVPGAEGETVAAVQEALVAAGIDVPGGADGVYGNDTMVAVAEYQRRNGGLQETGAVDVATARSLGVYEDPDASDDATDDDRARRRPSTPQRPCAHRRRRPPPASPPTRPTATAAVCPAGRSSLALVVVALAAARGGPPAIRGRPARGAALGARPSGDVAAPERRRHATEPASSRRRVRRPDLRPPAGATHRCRDRAPIRAGCGRNGRGSTPSRRR